MSTSHLEQGPSYVTSTVHALGISLWALSKVLFSLSSLFFVFSTLKIDFLLRNLRFRKRQMEGNVEIASLSLWDTLLMTLFKTVVSRKKKRGEKRERKEKEKRKKRKRKEKGKKKKKKRKEKKKEKKRKRKEKKRKEKKRKEKKRKEKKAFLPLLSFTSSPSTFGRCYSRPPRLSHYSPLLWHSCSPLILKKKKKKKKKNLCFPFSSPSPPTVPCIRRCLPPPCLHNRNFDHFSECNLDDEGLW